MYNCKRCNKPVEQSIEGEIICSKCWDDQQKSPEELEEEARIEQFVNHCADCDEKLLTGEEKGRGYCASCWERIALEAYIDHLKNSAKPGDHIPTIEDLQAPGCPYCGKTAVYDRNVERYFCCQTVIE